MLLCNLCSNLTIAKLYPPNIYHHAQNMAAVEQSAKTCPLCKTICQSVDWTMESQYSPQLGFQGAVDDAVPSTDQDQRDRDQCSLKLQIITGQLKGCVERGAITHLGVWMKSKYMVHAMTLLVEEGITSRSDMFQRCDNPNHR
jgi:hypothetical protein